MKASAIGRGLHRQAAALAGSLEYAVADVDAARPEFGEHRSVAASADIERRPEEAAVTMAPVAPVTATPVTATVHAVSTAMTTVTTSRSRKMPSWLRHLKWSTLEST